MHKRVYHYTAVNHHIIILSTSCVEISHLIILSTTPQCQLRVCEMATMITLYKRETQAATFLCTLCIRTYNKANMTNKHNQQNQTRPLATSATDRLARWAYTRATAAATKNRPSTRLLLKRDKNFCVYFTHLPGRPPWRDLHKILHDGSPRRRNQLCQIFSE